MNIQIYPSSEAMAKSAATLIAAQLTRKPNSVLGLATGSTPIPTYQAMIALQNEGALDFSRARTFNLDEYIGMAPDHEQSYHRFMKENLFDHVNLTEGSSRLPNGLAEDMDAECIAYEQAIAEAGGIDLQLLGIGHDGHIGFNEPCDYFPSSTHCTDLTAMTIEANQRFFASIDDVPRKAVTMGIGTIMRARSVLLLISGSDKADIAWKALKGAVTPMVPASILQFHPCCTVMLDQQAAAKFIEVR